MDLASDVYVGIRELLEAHGRPAREVYLDSENSGMIFPEALKAMVDAYEDHFAGHPSITHRRGWESYEALYKTSSTIAKFINCEPDELAFTHSGTEANNLAILGLNKESERKKIIVSAIEHLSVIFPAEQLEKQGYRVIKVPVDREGFVNLEFLINNVDKDTLLVSVGAVNHEIGTIQDLRAIVESVKDKDENIIFHTDACDALGRISLDVKKLNVDMASFSSHKVCGPKGAGALYIRDGVKIEPIIHGQLSTQKLWPGLENVPAIAGFGKAVELFASNFDLYVNHMKELRDLLIQGILSNVEHTLLNGPLGNKRSPDNVNVSVLYCEGEALTVDLSLNGIYVSSGSACTSRILQPSHVLLAIGREFHEAHGSILMKVAPLHSHEDVRYVVENVPRVVQRLRSISPLKPKEVG
ncbi:MAG: cysteine desulfurase family protein [Nitrososphaerota archaeon]|nr:cysteine desulfurase [Aigarchaeota archaeon]MDW8076539.1 cysteine desulfurase family protein [Nitrososphaerota archaeon]